MNFNATFDLSKLNVQLARRIVEGGVHHLVVARVYAFELVVLVFVPEV